MATRKRKTSTRRSKKAKAGHDELMGLNEAAVYAAKTGIEYVQKGISFVEDIAKQKNLVKTYPYLNQAFANVKGILSLAASSLKKECAGKAGKHVRAKKHKGHKKI